MCDNPGQHHHGDDGFGGKRLPRRSSDLAGWKPLVSEPRNTPMRRILSRLAMLVLGLGCLWVAYQAQTWGLRIEAEELDRARRDNSPESMLFLIALATGLTGAGFFAAAITPARWRASVLNTIWPGSGQ